MSISGSSPGYDVGRTIISFFLSFVFFGGVLGMVSALFGPPKCPFVGFLIPDLKFQFNFLQSSLHVFGPSCRSHVFSELDFIYFYFNFYLIYSSSCHNCVLICPYIMSSTLIAALLSVCMFACICAAAVLPLVRLADQSVTFQLLTDNDLHRDIFLTPNIDGNYECSYHHSRN